MADRCLGTNRDGTPCSAAPPTGRRVELAGTWTHRLAGGRIVEGREWGQFDWDGLLRQFGAPPGDLPSADRSPGG